MRKNYFSAIAVMVGYIIGVGMFGLPYLISKAGLATFFVFLIGLGLVQYLLHLTYANLIIVTKTYHRLPGYAGIYLGNTGKIVVFIAKLVGNYGALLAYIIITGIFLNQLLSPFFGEGQFFYASALFAAEAVVVFFGFRLIARVEFFMTLMLLTVVALIVFKGWGVINITNYELIDWRYFFLPYGAILFSLDGNGSLPIVVKLLRRHEASVKRVIGIATLLSILIIAIFTLVVVGISGANTTPDALIGVKQVLNDGVVLFSLIFGVLTMVTSFLLVAEAIKNTLSWDFKVGKKTAWALAVFVPYIMYITGMHDFIKVISFAGAVAGGLTAVMLFLIFWKLRKQKDKLVLFKHYPPKFVLAFLFVLFIFGILYEIKTFLF